MLFQREHTSSQYQKENESEKFTFHRYALLFIATNTEYLIVPIQQDGRGWFVQELQGRGKTDSV